MLTSSLLFAALEPHPISVAPFVALLLAVAVLPLLTPHWWHANRNKGIVVTALALPVTVYLLWPGRPGGAVELGHALVEYAAFIFMLSALYTISGGVVVRGGRRATPWRNAGLLAFGGLLANVVGTTGASMLLIRPFLRMNRGRKQMQHLVVFFIFVVSNLGGLLTPLGDPPLFLGFLKGVPFGWTLRLWPHWFVANGIVLAIFLIWDLRAFRHDPPVEDRGQVGIEPIRIVGLVNLGLLAAVLAVVLLQSATVGSALGAWLRLGDLTLSPLTAGFVLLGIAVVSLLVTPRGLREENAFSWGPILEVAVLFAGLFVTMVPALALLRQHGAAFGLTVLSVNSLQFRRLEECENAVERKGSAA